MNLKKLSEFWDAKDAKFWPQAPNTFAMCNHRIQKALRHQSPLSWDENTGVLAPSSWTAPWIKFTNASGPVQGIPWIHTHTQHCFLVFGPPNFGLSRQLMHSPQSCSFWQPLQLPQRVMRFFLPWDMWRRTGFGAFTAISVFTCFGWLPSLSEAEEVSVEGKVGKINSFNCFLDEKTERRCKRLVWLEWTPSTCGQEGDLHCWQLGGSIQHYMEHIWNIWVGLDLGCQKRKVGPSACRAHTPSTYIYISPSPFVFMSIPSNIIKKY